MPHPPSPSSTTTSSRSPPRRAAWASRPTPSPHSSRRPPMAVDRPPALSRFVLVAVVLPVVIALVAVGVQLVMLPQVPDPVAIHWNASGVADGFASPWLYPLMTLLV